eukprot:7394256-Heterocapsa_arctica.AAC.1
MSSPSDWDMNAPAFAPLPSVGTFLRLDATLVGERTGLTFARASWPQREHLDHPAGLITAS